MVGGTSRADAEAEDELPVGPEIDINRGEELLLLISERVKAVQRATGRVVFQPADAPPTVKINQDSVRWEDLETRLAQIYLKPVEKVAFVRGDGDLDFQYVANVIDVAHHVGVQRVGLLTKGQEVAGE